MNWVAAARAAAGSVDALIMLYALVRAFAFDGANRFMRLALSAFAAVLTYSQASLLADPVPLTSRTVVGWGGSVVVLGLWIAAIRADKRVHDAA